MGTALRSKQRFVSVIPFVLELVQIRHHPTVISGCGDECGETKELRFLLSS
jgi:hypothetical protein